MATLRSAATKLILATGFTKIPENHKIAPSLMASLRKDWTWGDIAGAGIRKLDDGREAYLTVSYNARYYKVDGQKYLVSIRIYNPETHNTFMLTCSCQWSVAEVLKDADWVSRWLATDMGPEEERERTMYKERYFTIKP